MCGSKKRDLPGKGLVRISQGTGAELLLVKAVINACMQGDVLLLIPPDRLLQTQQGCVFQSTGLQAAG